MTNTREQLEQREDLRPALTWALEDGTLSGGERALASTLHTLVEHFDRLDGKHQQAIIESLAAVTEETVALESQARAILARRASEASGTGNESREGS